MTYAFPMASSQAQPVLTLAALFQQLGMPRARQLVLLVGAPASGKSRIARAIAELFGYVYLSADAIRREILGNEADQGDGGRVFDLLNQRLEAAMAAGLSIVVDNTNVSRRLRKPLLKRAAAAGYSDVQIILLDTPLELCLERNSKRTRVVPDEVVRGIFGAMQRSGLPRAHEGSLAVVRPGSDEDGYVLVQLTREEGQR